jgi:uncharacterized repeat protein (TIGR03943 family)
LSSDHTHHPGRGDGPATPGRWSASAGASKLRPSGPTLGLVLALIGSVATLWLASTGRLGLYIHPRYFVFTTIVVGLGLVGTVAAHAIAGREPADDHDHDHPEPTGWRRRLRGSGGALAVLALGLGLLVIPPATLTSSTVEQRSLNSSADAELQLMGGDPAHFQLRDWAALLSRHSTATAYAGQEITLSGFVTSGRTQNPDLFYLARFVVVCCTVDAQPVGVPVALENWAANHPKDSWVQLTGTLVLSDDPTLSGVVLKPTAIEAIEQPAQPYDF